MVNPDELSDDVLLDELTEYEVESVLEVDDTVVDMLHLLSRPVINRVYLLAISVGIRGIKLFNWYKLRHAYF